jgi:dTDP-4-dehydrorhamnose 3,5-epimerase
MTMIFQPTPLPGVFVIEPELHTDERGFFARTWCRREMAAKGLGAELSQCSVSFNRKRGTVRGMHYQAAPHAETKLVRCIRGSIFDVALDLRPESPTYCRWFAIELTADNRRALYIPEGLAHGFQSLTDEAEVFYEISTDFVPTAARGVRWNDAAFRIDWPIREGIILSQRDASYADYCLCHA